jgi:hypothetical protein
MGLLGVKLPSDGSAFESAALSKKAAADAARCVTFRVSASFATSKRMTWVGVFGH